MLIGAAATFDNPAARDLEQAVRELRDPVPRAFVEEFSGRASPTTSWPS